MVEEVGVAALELLGERASLPANVVEEERGEAVPELESFFFEEFLESLARASCSCYKFSELRQGSVAEGVGSRGCGGSGLRRGGEELYAPLVL